MVHLLKNYTLEIHMDLPLEGYSFGRFDWTGKITQVKYRHSPVTTIERTDKIDLDLFGKGLYNEFGIDTALGFEEARPGEWFQKIGVGALQKTEGAYQFTTPFKIRPAQFQFEAHPDRVLMRCLSESLNGYAYELRKEFCLRENGLIINYELDNKGQKTIETDEYIHNFMGVDQQLIDKDYVLHFPFKLDQRGFRALVDPENKMLFGEKQVGFNARPVEQFFISHLNGGHTVPAVWELHYLKSGIGIRETGSFSTQKVNLWGWGHVISPELFHRIIIPPGETASWKRHYEFFDLP